MGVLTYDDDPVTSPLCGEPSLPLGTIVEAQEGSTGDESETETLPDPSVPPPSLSLTSYSNLKKVIMQYINSYTINPSHNLIVLVEFDNITSDSVIDIM